MTSKTQQLVIAGRRITVTNLEKVLYPGGRFTKAHVIDYYIRIANYLLPHLKDRPVTLKRFPNGIFGEFFYEKDAPAFTPKWVKTFPVPRRNRSEPDIRYILINDLPTLVWLANLANLEIHPFLHRVPRIDRPTWIVFDLDPGAGADILTCAQVAFMLRDVLAQLDLESFIKVSGSKGLQLYVPLNTTVTYEQTQPFAKAIAQLLAEREPNLIVSEMPKVFRAKKVFIDWSQNAGFKTTVSVYSLRAKTHKPYVSMPVEWKELTLALEKGDVESLYFKPEEALSRVKSVGDLFKPVLMKKQKLPSRIALLGKTTGKHTVKKRSAAKSSKARRQTVRASRQGGRRRFVISKHAQGKLQYEFWLELSRFVKCWSMAKGFPLKKGEKRLVSVCEDRSIEYFEEVFSKQPSSNSTAGVWDVGTYDLVEGDYASGFLRIYLANEKLKGEWTLTRLSDEEGDKWELRKTSGGTRLTGN